MSTPPHTAVSKSDQPLITLDSLRFGYQPQQGRVFDGLSLAITAGSATAILGPNGAGKTTLLHLILGMLTPEAGEVIFAGQRQTAHSHRRISRSMALVPQSEYIPFDFSLLDYVLLGRAPHLALLQAPAQDDVQQALAALSAVGLAEHWRRPAPNLSGGERQLAMLARALAQQPRVLLLDEPTSHLDLSNRGRVLAILRRLVGQGVTIIFTTHDPNLAFSLADQVILMRGGAVLAAGAAATTLTAPHLSDLYGTPVEVHTAGGHPLVWAE